METKLLNILFVLWFIKIYRAFFSEGHKMARFRIMTLKQSFLRREGLKKEKDKIILQPFIQSYAKHELGHYNLLNGFTS